MRIKEIRSEDNLTLLPLPKVNDPDLNSKMAEQGDFRLKLLNQVNHMAEVLARKDSKLPFPYDYDRSFEEFLDFRKKLDRSYEAFLRLQRVRSSSR
jgi:hypothetical protein